MEKNATETYGMLQAAFGATTLHESEHQFLSGIRDSRKAGSLWGVVRGVGGVRKSYRPELIRQRVRARVTMLRFYGSSGRDCIGRSQHSSNRVWHFQLDNASVHNSILVTDYLIKMGINTYPPCIPTLAPCDFWLFPKLRGCRYETIEEMKEAVTKFIDTLTRVDFHGAFKKLLER